MSDIYVVYFSSTGNTEEMAKHVADGIERKGGNPVLTEIGSADPDHLKEASAFALGCPACGAEELDESMESLIEEISGSLEGKHVGLFGSYGWAAATGCASGRSAWRSAARRSSAVRASSLWNPRTETRRSSLRTWVKRWRSLALRLNLRLRLMPPDFIVGRQELFRIIPAGHSFRSIWQCFLRCIWLQHQK